MTDTNGALPGLCYVVVRTDERAPNKMRADPIVWDDYGAAISRQFELGNLTKQPCWIMSFPDPRNVAND